MDDQKTNKSREFLIRVGVTRNYGAHSMYFEISEQVVCENGLVRRDAFINLQEQLDDQVAVYEAYYLPNVRMPFNAVDEASKHAGSIDSFKLKSIRVENTKGKRYVKAVGGKYEKFGVNIYEESQVDVINTDELAYGEHDFSKSDFTVTVLMNGDKPKKVLSIK